MSDLESAVTELIEALKACLLEDERRHNEGERSDLVCGAAEVAVLHGGGLACSSPEQLRLHDALAALTGAARGGLR
ncbi:MAG TPA: hypothetical protein VEA41_02990 [Salinarimonas sp.]|nr:hypothetical protein [Salinarimonas sp.]